MNRAALRVALSDVLPAAESKDRGRLAAALEKMQNATDDALPDDKIEREARKSGDQINANHRRLFFLAALAQRKTPFRFVVMTRSHSSSSRSIIWTDSANTAALLTKISILP